ncbi:MAG: hypothetical protein LBD07_00780 [Spirochaetaceae bacterium]|jgi:hypothetical protein|nr:hypothetical protein [Spirochaetaceae bacterium]
MKIEIKIYVLLILFCGKVWAQDDAPVESVQNKIKVDQMLMITTSSLPEAQFSYICDWKIPFLKGSSALTKDNNITLHFRANISPVNFDFSTEIIWTPIAFLELNAGLTTGSGWHISLLGKEIYGIGISGQAIDGSSVVDSEPFSGVISKLRFGGALQADVAAFSPGEWHHIVVRTYHEVNYFEFSAANNDQSWYYANDSGENTNGFNYNGNFLIGYQMPLFLNFTGIMTEANLRMRPASGGTLWGDDVPYLLITALANFKVSEKFDFRIICQFQSKRNYTDDNWELLYYRNRHIDNNDKFHIEFYRVAGMFMWHL